MVEYVLYFLAVILIIDIGRRAGNLIDEIREEEEEDAEIVGRSIPISRRTYDKIG